MGAYELSLVTLVGINVILALSLNLITGFCGQISLGHAAFYGTGAYACALVSQAGLPFYAGLAAGGLVAGAVGLVVGLASLRVRHDFLAITTMGVGFLFVGIVRQQEALGGEIGLTIAASHGLGSLGFALFVAALAAVVAWFSLYVKRSWMGFCFDAVADDEDTARLVGIDVARYKLTAFGLGTALAGVAGGLYTQYSGIIVPDAFGFVVSITILAMVVVGGIGSTFGVLGATVVLTLLPLVFQFIDDYKLLLYGGLLFVVMRFFPGGLAELLRRARPARRSP